MQTGCNHEFVGDFRVIPFPGFSEFDPLNTGWEVVHAFTGDQTIPTAHTPVFIERKTNLF
jgi:hypothetical protein